MKKLFSRKKQQLLTAGIALSLMLGSTAHAAGIVTDLFSTDSPLMVDSAEEVTPDGTISGGTVGSKVYFGKYENAPILWTVIGKTENSDKRTLTVLSDISLGDSAFWDGSTPSHDGLGVPENDWEHSTVRNNLNNFYANIFNDVEKSSVETTKNITVYIQDGTTNSKETDDRLYLLSIDEARALNSSTLQKVENYWRLRSPGSADCEAATVNVGSVVEHSPANYVYNTYVAVRPAFQLNLESVIFASAAEGGKSFVSNGKFSKMADITADTPLKLTVEDYHSDANPDGQKLLNLTLKDTNLFSGSVAMSYANAQTGNNEYVSAILDNETGAYYAPTSVTSYASGDLVFTQSDNALANGTYTLHIYNEKAAPNSSIDLAGEMTDFQVTVEGSVVSDITLLSDRSITLNSTKAVLSLDNTKTYTGTFTLKDGATLKATPKAGDTFALGKVVSSYSNGYAISDGRNILNLGDVDLQGNTLLFTLTDGSTLNGIKINVTSLSNPTDGAVLLSGKFAADSNVDLTAINSLLPHISRLELKANTTYVAYEEGGAEAKFTDTTGAVVENALAISGSAAPTTKFYTAKGILAGENAFTQTDATNPTISISALPSPSTVDTVIGSYSAKADSTAEGGTVLVDQAFAGKIYAGQAVDGAKVGSNTVKVAENSTFSLENTAFYGRNTEADVADGSARLLDLSNWNPTNGTGTISSINYFDEVHLNGNTNINLINASDFTGTALKIYNPANSGTLLTGATGIDASKIELIDAPSGDPQVFEYKDSHQNVIGYTLATDSLSAKVTRTNDLQNLSLEAEHTEGNFLTGYYTDGTNTTTQKTLTLADNSIPKDMFAGAYADAGAAEDAATGGKVEITGDIGTADKKVNVYGGYAVGADKTVSGNTVTVSGTADVANANLYGSNNTKGSNNVLNLSTWTNANKTIGSIDKFNTINLGASSVVTLTNASDFTGTTINVSANTGEGTLFTGNSITGEDDVKITGIVSEGTTAEEEKDNLKGIVVTRLSKDIQIDTTTSIGLKVKEDIWTGIYGGAAAAGKTLHISGTPTTKANYLAGAYSANGNATGGTVDIASGVALNKNVYAGFTDDETAAVSDNKIILNAGVDTTDAVLYGREDGKNGSNNILEAIGAGVKVGMIKNFDKVIGEDLTLSEDNTVKDMDVQKLTLDKKLTVTGTANVTDKLTLTDANNVLNIGTSDTRGVLSANDIALGGGTLFLDPAFKDGEGIESASMAAINTDNIDGKYIAGQNSVITFGTADVQSAVDAFNADDKLKWGAQDVTAAMYIADKVTLAEGGALCVNGSLTSAPTGLTNKALTFGENSLLMVLGDKAKTSAVINGAVSSTIADTSKLYIADVTKNDRNTVYHIINGTDTGFWKDENVFTQDAKIKFSRVENAGAIDYLAASANIKDIYEGKVIIDDVLDAINEDPNATQVQEDFIAKASDNILYTTEQQIGIMNSLGAMNELTGVSHLTQLAVGEFADTIASESPNVNGSDAAPAAASRERTFWGHITHKQEKVNDLDIAGKLSANYSANVTGAAIGSDIYNDGKQSFGVAFTYFRGDVDGNNSVINSKNEADLVGTSLYGRKHTNSADFIADLTYLHGEHSLKQNYGFTTVTSKAKSDAFSLGGKVQFAMNVKAGQLTPYVGLRYTHLGIGSHTNSLGLTYDADDQNLFNIPIGISYSNKIKNDDWEVAPYIDLGYQFNLGDIDSTENVIYGTTKDSFDYSSTKRGFFVGKLGVCFGNGISSYGIDYQYSKASGSHANRFSVNFQTKF